MIATSKELSDRERAYLQRATRAVVSKRDLSYQMLSTVMQVLNTPPVQKRRKTS